MKMQRRKFNAEVPSVAMGDIAFLLLIFIMVMATAKKPPDSHVVAEPPEASKPEETRPAVAWVAVDNQGLTYLNGKRIEPDELHDKLEALLTAIPFPDRIVETKIHRTTPASVYGKVLLAFDGVATPKIIHREPKRG
jgi:biopolymer transport protein ExbD